MEDQHAKFLAAAAKRQLAPLGLKRKGRSRTWLDDQKWFVTIVEFQPSGFSKGSYLNVGVHFLWTWSGHFSFDLGHRLEEFISFDSEVQFASEADRLVARAKDEVQRLQALLTDPSIVAVVLPEEPQCASWSTYHRAVSLGLSDHAAEASKAFSQLIDPPHPHPWMADRAARCRALRDLLATPQAFREAVNKLIQEQRHALRLPSAVQA